MRYKGEKKKVCSKNYIYIYICIYLHIIKAKIIFSFSNIYLNKDRYIESFPSGLVGKESSCNAGDMGPIPWSGRSPKGGHGKLLQYSCLENPMQRRAQ